MININKQGIGYTDFGDISGNQKEFTEYLFKTRIDFIIDCSKVMPRKKFIKKLFVHQKNVQKCFVIVISSDYNLKFNKEWNIVPSKNEAFDFIYFEKIQREIRD